MIAIDALPVPLSIVPTLSMLSKHRAIAIDAIFDLRQ